MAKPDTNAVNLLTKNTKYDGGVPTPAKPASKWGRAKGVSTAPQTGTKDEVAAKKSFIASVINGDKEQKKERTNYAAPDEAPGTETDKEKPAEKPVKVAAVSKVTEKVAVERAKPARAERKTNADEASAQAPTPRKPRIAADSPERIIADAEKMEKQAKVLREKAKALAKSQATKTLSARGKELARIIKESQAELASVESKLSKLIGN